MNKRKNESLNQYLLDDKEFKIFLSLQKRLGEYLELLNYLYELKKIKYSVMIIKASEKSIKKTISHKVSLISFETTPPKLLEVCYEIMYIMKKFKEKTGDDYWIEIKRF